MRTPYATCPLCESESFTKVREDDCTIHPLYQAPLPPTMTWMACHDCNHVFTSGYYTEKALGILFSKTHENQQVGHDLERQRPISARMVEKVLPHMDKLMVDPSMTMLDVKVKSMCGWQVSSSRWLDVGFGNGSLLLTAQEYGFDPLGLDMRPDSVKAMHELGVGAFCCALGDPCLCLPAGSYAVVSMADVLEHVPFPKQTLSEAHRLLEQNGILLLSMPNSECAVWQAMDRANANPYWYELEHYHNFSRTRLYALLRECGFEPVMYGISERYRACMEVIARKVTT